MIELYWELFNSACFCFTMFIIFTSVGYFFFFDYFLQIAIKSKKFQLEVLSTSEKIQAETLEQRYLSHQQSELLSFNDQRYRPSSSRSESFGDASSSALPRAYVQKEGIIVPVGNTRRGHLWSKHPSWQLPSVIREPVISYQGIEHVASILKRFDVDPFRGFLPSQDPLQRLPYHRYHLWEDLADDLPKLLGARLGQAREPLRHLPVLSTDKLVTDAELRRAHLLLCLFAHAYVWGGLDVKNEIPKGIAVPLCEVSKKLGIPPVLGHPSIVLYNWRRLDDKAAISMDNISTLNNFFDGRDESWFYLITVEVEARGAKAVCPIMLAIDAIQRMKEEHDVLFNENGDDDYDDGAETDDSSADNTFSDNDTMTSAASAPNRSRHSLIGSAPTLSYDSGQRRCLIRDTSDCSEDELDGNLNSNLGSQEEVHPALPNGNDNSANATGTCNTTARSTVQKQRKQLIMSEALVGALTLKRVAEYVTAQLEKICFAIQGMTHSLACMSEGCHPFIFYHRVRPFLSAWKHNPTLPNGVIYQGVDSKPLQYYGGSAAQSSLLPMLDIALGVTHENIKSGIFLKEMRDYMIKPHREFLHYLTSVACIRDFVIDCHRDFQKYGLLEETVVRLRSSYDSCVSALKDFRTGHITLVAEFILAQQQKGNINNNKIDGNDKKDSLGKSAGGKGTGGTDLMRFLKPIRDNCIHKLLRPPSPPQEKEKTEGGGGERESRVGGEGNIVGVEEDDGLNDDDLSMIDGVENSSSSSQYYKDHGGNEWN